MKFTEIQQKVKRKLGYFILKEETPEKFSPWVIIGLRHVFQESSPQPINPLMQNQRLLPVKTIHGLFCRSRLFSPFIKLSIHYEIKA
jgi:hypothetical protein